MKKEEIRREFFKLKLKGHSYSQCKKILKGIYGYQVTIRTLKRWVKRLDNSDWDLRDESRKPETIRYKITPEIENKVVEIRKKTGHGENKIESHISGLISHTSINKILNKHNLCKESKVRKRRIKWVRFQRKHPNSMWQIDHSDQKIKDKWCLSVIDDCSRYSLALIPLVRVTTNNVTKILDDLIKIYGKPREILTDNGSAYGLRSKNSRFDRWCKKRGIKHIRSSVHNPQTVGKVERLFRTLDEELKFCNDNLECFRMRYNHFRPHSSLNNKTPAQKYNDFSSLI